MELPVRKPNRLSGYDYSQNGAYFVTICTQDRKKFLSHIVGDGFPVPQAHGMIAEEFIRQIPVKYPSVAVDKYVIMPDHIHLILRFDMGNGTGNPSPTMIPECGNGTGKPSPTMIPECRNGTGNPSPTLGTVIGWYKYQVTKQINLSANTEGEKVFQRSYYDHVIRNQQDYDEIWQYIENNPMKWVMEKRGFE